MRTDKKLRKQKYRAFLINKEGFIVDIKDRGEYATYEDEFCIGSFEISGSFGAACRINNLKISAKNKNYIISQSDIEKVKNNISTKIK